MHKSDHDDPSWRAIPHTTWPVIKRIHSLLGQGKVEEARQLFAQLNPTHLRGTAVYDSLAESLQAGQVSESRAKRGRSRFELDQTNELQDRSFDPGKDSFYRPGASTYERSLHHPESDASAPDDGQVFESRVEQTIRTTRKYALDANRAEERV